MSVVKPAIRQPALIAYLAGANNYTWLHFRNGEKKMLAKPISYLEEQLTDFIRVHKTALVNPVCVKSLQEPPRQRMAGSVQLEDGVVLPVSRRRWRDVVTALQPYLLPDDGPAPAYADATLPNQPPAPPAAKAATRSIVLVTDEGNTDQIKWTVESRWPQYVVHTMAQSSHLPEVLRVLLPDELPTLILLDARTQTLERLNTLQTLKQLDRFCHIPVVMVTPPADATVSDSYRRQANSVIVLPDSQASLLAAIERTCQFWLRTAALPLAA